MILLYILIALVVLLAMVTIHEFGHYLSAKLLGFSVDEFSIGFGPRLFRKEKKNGEVFSVRLLPLGGYCAFTDEDSLDDPPFAEVVSCGTATANSSICRGKDGTNLSTVRAGLSGSVTAVGKDGATEPNEPATKRGSRRVAFAAQKPWKRLIVMLCGPLFNLLSAFVFSFIFIISMGYSLPVVTELYVDPATGAPYASGLMTGDVIVGVDGKRIGVLTSFNELIAGVGEDGGAVLTVMRGGSEIDVTVRKQSVLVPAEGGGYTPRILFGFVQSYERQSVGFFPSIGYAFPYTFKLCGQIFAAFGNMLTGRLPLTQLSGPIGTVSAIATYMQMGWEYMLLLLPLLACNFAIFNILPIPSLDGARAVFVIIEWIRKKPINKKAENIVHAVGLMTLLAFVVVIDIIGLLT